MSEPLTSHEIEDVLSSIRRLVSEELRPTTRQAAAPVAPRSAGEPGEAGKLLLTPALRVVMDPPADPGPTLADEPADPAPVPPASTAVDDSLDTLLEDGLALEDWSPAAAVSAIAPADDVYDDVGLDEGDTGLNVLLGSVTPAHGPDTDGDGLAADDRDGLIWSAAGVPEAAADPSAPDLRQDPAYIPESRDDGHRDGPGHWTAQDLPGVNWVDEESDWVEPEPVAFVAHPRKAETAQDPLARAWADRAEAEVRAELEAKLAAARAQTPPPQDTARAELFEGDESEIDDEALRDMVRDIIREELAGALGERITRNVRKLVRVEINRALTAREFD